MYVESIKQHSEKKIYSRGSYFGLKENEEDESNLRCLEEEGRLFIRQRYPRATPLLVCTCPPCLSLGPGKGNGDDIKNKVSSVDWWGHISQENIQNNPIQTWCPAPLWVYQYLIFNTLNYLTRVWALFIQF